MTRLPTPETCNACPHGGVCCKHGTDLTAAEAVALMAEFGPDVIVIDADGDSRTALKGGTCIFHRNGRCIIHGLSTYPAVCRAFPHEDGILGGPHAGDTSDCPETR